MNNNNRNNQPVFRPSSSVRLQRRHCLDRARISIGALIRYSAVAA